MNYRQLGNSGVRVSVIGLGANRFGSEKVPQTEVDRIIAAALDLGINFIDTSNNYTGAIQKKPLAKRSKDAATRSCSQQNSHSQKRMDRILGARRATK